MEKELVATVYLFLEGKTLLHFHPKMQRYLPPGGHIEKNETPQEAALREVKEETGLQIHFFSEENLLIQEKDCKSLLRPYLCLLEDVPAIENQKPHQHIDFIYVARPLFPNQKPLPPFTWFSQEQIDSLDTSLFFPDTLQILSSLWDSPILEKDYHLLS